MRPVDSPQSADHERWQAMLAGVLRRSGAPDYVAAEQVGAGDVDPEQVLTRHNLDGIAIKPLYTADDLVGLSGVGSLPGAAPFRRGTGGPAHSIDVRAHHQDTDPERSNIAILADLAGGVRSIWLTVGDGGLDLAALPTALAGVDLTQTPVLFGGTSSPLKSARSLLALAAERGFDAAQLRGGAGADPLGTQARTGIDADLTELAPLTTLVAGTRLTPISVDGTVYADAGGSDSDELAAAAATGVAYVRVLADAGIAAPFDACEFRYSVSADQFSSIAKLRAARVVWSRIGELSGERAPQRQHAVTSMAMVTRRDPWLNIVRNTLACLAAVSGGAPTITVLPFDAALGLPDGFARRIARNTAAIALEESGLARVTDPAGGSYYLEALTQQLAEAAWTKLVAIEKAGGAVSALNSGMISSMLDDSRRRREAELAARTEPVVGVSMFADLTEKPVHRIQLPQQAQAQHRIATPPSPTSTQLPVVRYAEPFERLRDRVEAHRLAFGAAPRVVLATLGTASAHAARAGFVQDLLAVAGVETTLMPADDATLAGPVVCLCGRDADYRDRGLAAVKALRSVGAKTVYVAGKPELALAADGYLYSGCDAVLALGQVLTSSGVQ